MHVCLKAMRVIGGELRSRRLVAPRGMGTRPTSDRLRETLFNVLRSRLAGASFLDLYAGSGAVGIEVLSRGASFCGFAERAPAALSAVHANVAALGLGTRVSVQPFAASRALAEFAKQGRLFDVVFLDPPYEAARDYTDTLALLGRGAGMLLAPGAVVVAEHARRVSLQASYGGLERTRVLEQGDAALSFFEVLVMAAGEGARSA